jgi:phenylacetate-CoA ligase
VQVVLESPLTEALRARITAGFQARLGVDVAIDVSQVDAILPEKSGKFRYVVSKLDAANAQTPRQP